MPFSISSYSFKMSTYYRLSSNDEKGADNFIINELSDIQ